MQMYNKLYTTKTNNNNKLLKRYTKLARLFVACVSIFLFQSTADFLYQPYNT